MNHVLNIAWIAIRELLYERVFYVLILFALAALGVSALLGQLTYTEHAKLTLDFMLAGIQISMVLFSVFMGISLLQRELQLGSIAMILSKPIQRGHFLLGKFTGQVAVQAVVMLAMTAVTILFCPDGENVSYSAIFQCVGLAYFEVLVITSIAYLFAINAGAIMAALATLFLFILGHFTSVSSTVKNPVEKVTWSIIKSFVPNLEVFNTKSLASYGFQIPWEEFGYAGLYALILITMFLAIAVLTFERKDILT
jgi:Cu-processing system permease protein